MAELRITQFHAGRHTNTSFSTVYTVPTGRRIIVKSIYAVNRTGSAAFLDVDVHNAYYLLHHQLAASGSVGSELQWDMWVVLNAGDGIDVAVGTGATIDVVISGTNHFV